MYKKNEFSRTDKWGNVVRKEDFDKEKKFEKDDKKDSEISYSDFKKHLIGD